MNFKLMNSQPTMSLEEIELSLLKSENELLRAHLARRMGRSPNHVMSRVAAEGLFDIFKPKVQKAKQKEKTIEERLAELYQRVKNHRPSDKTFQATGLLALIKNSQNFKQTIADLKSAITAEEDFLRHQLDVHGKMCHVWNKMAADGDLRDWYREESKLYSAIRPIAPKGFKQKLAPSNRSDHKDWKFVFYHNALETVCVETPFTDFQLQVTNRSHEPDQDRLDDPYFSEFIFRQNHVYFTPGPLNQFHGSYEGRADETLHSDVLDLIEFVEKAVMDSYSYNDLHMEKSEFKKTASLSSSGEVSPALRRALKDDDFNVDQFLTYGYSLAETIYQGDLIDGVYSTEFMVEHLAIAFLQT